MAERVGGLVERVQAIPSRGVLSFVLVGEISAASQAKTPEFLELHQAPCDLDPMS